MSKRDAFFQRAALLPLCNCRPDQDQMAKPKSSHAEQHREFIKAARELDTDEDEAAFNRRLRQIASAPPPKSVQTRKASAKDRKKKD